MANNPQKAKDATAEALSAIQEALNVRESDLPTAAPHVEPPYVEAPKVEAPIADAPRAETPRFEAPRIESPRAEAPRMERPPVAPVSNADLFHQEPEPTGWADEEPPRRR